MIVWSYAAQREREREREDKMKYSENITNKDRIEDKKALLNMSCVEKPIGWTYIKKQASSCGHWRSNDRSERSRKE